MRGAGGGADACCLHLCVLRPRPACAAGSPACQACAAPPAARLQPRPPWLPAWPLWRPSWQGCSRRRLPLTPVWPPLAPAVRGRPALSRPCARGGAAHWTFRVRALPVQVLAAVSWSSALSHHSAARLRYPLRTNVCVYSQRLLCQHLIILALLVFVAMGLGWHGQHPDCVLVKPASLLHHVTAWLAGSSELQTVKGELQHLKDAVAVLANATHLMALPQPGSRPASPPRSGGGQRSTWGTLHCTCPSPESSSCCAPQTACGLCLAAEQFLQLSTEAPVLL